MSALELILILWLGSSVGMTCMDMPANSKRQAMLEIEKPSTKRTKALLSVFENWREGNDAFQGHES